MISILYTYIPAAKNKIYNFVDVKKNLGCTIGKFYKLISGEKNLVKKKDKKHTCYLKIIKQHVCLVKRKNTDWFTYAKT